MATDIRVYTQSYQTPNRSWHLSPHGGDFTPSCAVDLTTFTQATHYPNGFIPSGTVLGLITAASDATKNIVGPYASGATDGRQTAWGILYNDVRVTDMTGNVDTSKKIGDAAVVHGFVKISKLPIANGAAGGGFIDAAGQTALKLIYFVTA